MSAWAAGPPKLNVPPSDDWPLGSTVKVVTVTGVAPIQGQVIAFDKCAGVACLKAADEVVVLNVNTVKEVLTRTPPPAGFVPESMLEVDDARAQRRLDDGLRGAEAASLRLGVGVTRTAQNLFDAISKTHPCHWDGKDIVVLEEVHIQPPYTPDKCTGGSAAACERVRLVLQNERSRLGLTAAA